MLELAGLLSAFGLASAAGLNAYLPLLIVGLTARYTGLLTLQGQYEILTSPGVLIALALLAVVEIVADKVPAVDHLWHLLGLVMHPTAGAILFASQQNILGEVHPALALICGLLVAGGLHSVRASVRPLVTTTTAGVGNSVVSTLEDITSVIWTLLAILAPLIGAILIGAMGWFAYRTVGRRRRRAA